MMNEFYIYMLMSVVIAAFSQLLLKKAAQNHYSSMVWEYLNIWVISGYVLMVLSTLLTVVAYKGLDYKNGPIIESLGFVFVMILSRTFFREQLTKKKVIGNIFIFLGIFVFYS